MNEENNLSNFANDNGSFTSIQRIPDYRHPQSNATDMADVGSVIFVTCSALAITVVIRRTLRSQKFTQDQTHFRKQSALVQAAVAGALFIAVVNGSLKPQQNLSPDASRYSASAAHTLVMDAAQTLQNPLSQIASRLDFTENQRLAGFALTSVVTNETFNLSAPSNATVHANWLKRGAAEDGFWV